MSLKREEETKEAFSCVADSQLSVEDSLSPVLVKKGWVGGGAENVKRHDWNPQWGSTCDPPLPVTRSSFVQHVPL